MAPPEVAACPDERVASPGVRQQAASEPTEIDVERVVGIPELSMICPRRIGRVRAGASIALLSNNAASIDARIVRARLRMRSYLVEWRGASMKHDNDMGIDGSRGPHAVWVRGGEAGSRAKLARSRSRE
jgi:hypothetical protein